MPRVSTAPGLRVEGSQPGRFSSESSALRVANIRTSRWIDLYGQTTREDESLE